MTKKGKFFQFYFLHAILPVILPSMTRLRKFLLCEESKNLRKALTRF